MENHGANDGGEPVVLQDVPHVFERIETVVVLDIARIFVALFVSYTAVALACMVAPLVTDIRLAPVNVILMAFIINFALMASSRVIVK